MTSLLLKQNAINVDIEPTSFKVGSPSVAAGKANNLTLELDREGLRLIKKGRSVSTTGWYEVEDLKNSIRTKGMFSYLGMIDPGLGPVKALVRVRVGDDSGERERLAQIFDKLPQDVFGQKCPECGGSVIDDLCKNCGRSFKGEQRRKGMSMIMIGSIVFVLGILMSYATYNSSSGSVWIFYGAILLGAGMIIGGLIALIFGARV